MSQRPLFDGLDIIWYRIWQLWVGGAIVLAALVVLMVVNSKRRAEVARERELREQAQLSSRARAEELEAVLRESESVKEQLKNEQRRHEEAERARKESAQAAIAERDKRISTELAAEEWSKRQAAEQAQREEAEEQAQRAASRAAELQRELAAARRSAADQAAILRANEAARRLSERRDLEAEVKQYWQAAERSMDSGSATAYVDAAASLATAMTRLRAFEGSHGTDSETNRLRSGTADLLSTTYAACAAENSVNRARGSREIPCPTRR